MYLFLKCKKKKISSDASGCEKTFISFGSFEKTYKYIEKLSSVCKSICKANMPCPSLRLSLEWEGVTQIQTAVQEAVSKDTLALVLVAEKIEMANGNISRAVFNKFVSMMVSDAFFYDQRFTNRRSKERFGLESASDKHG